MNIESPKFNVFDKVLVTTKRKTSRKDPEASPKKARKGNDVIEVVEISHHVASIIKVKYTHVVEYHGEAEGFNLPETTTEKLKGWLYYCDDGQTYGYLGNNEYEATLELLDTEKYPMFK